MRAISTAARQPAKPPPTMITSKLIIMISQLLIKLTAYQAFCQNYKIKILLS
ncbi:hypothetical protein RINTHM_12530 [Richelia intracellularis HM01]|nr:hypothetical protein RINTHM_12530 [Richelia intracellularis HM01]